MAGLLPELLALWDNDMDVFAEGQTAPCTRLRGLSQSDWLGRHTTTGLLCTTGRQFADRFAD
jgi:hypothetical protein